MLGLGLFLRTAFYCAAKDLEFKRYQFRKKSTWVWMPYLCIHYGLFSCNFLEIWHSLHLLRRTHHPTDDNDSTVHNWKTCIIALLGLPQGNTVWKRILQWQMLVKKELSHSLSIGGVRPAKIILGMLHTPNLLTKWLLLGWCWKLRQIFETLKVGGIWV